MMNSVPTPNFERLLALLPKDWQSEVILGGSAILAVMGVRDVHDLDIIGSPALIQRVRTISQKHECASQGGFTLSPRYRPFPEIDLFDGFAIGTLRGTLSLSFSHLQAISTTSYKGWAILPEYVWYTMKALLDREKDAQDLQLFKAWRQI